MSPEEKAKCLEEVDRTIGFMEKARKDAEESFIELTKLDPARKEEFDKIVADAGRAQEDILKLREQILAMPVTAEEPGKTA
jgi:hypothetical protein